MTEKIIADKGLAGVVAGDSAVSKVDVHINQLIYRGYDIGELCEHSDFLETAYLLFNGSLPNTAEKKEFDALERKSRTLPEGTLDLFRNVSPTAHPMDYLRLGVNYIGLLDSENNPENHNPAGIISMASRLFSQIPNLLANSYRVVNGLKTIAPDPDLSYSENFLYMLRGKKQADELEVKVFDSSMILYAEHGFNASTFSCRVTASTLSDYYSAVCSGIGTLKGPLHGGANEAVMHMLMDIGEVSKAESYVLDLLAHKAKIMGFGHRLYRSGDSRTGIIQNLGLKLARKKEETKWHDISKIVEDTMKREKNIFPNLDFPSATAYYLLGIPIELYTPLFVASRLTGWTAHLLEQYGDNRLIRPSSRYTGPDIQPVPKLEER